MQETKFKGMDSSIARDFWGSEEVDWSYADAEGASGGLLIMWKKKVIDSLFSFKGDGFLGICIDIDGLLNYYVNIYASCDISKTQLSWNNLVSFKNNNSIGAWCVGGISIPFRSKKIG